MVRPVSKLIFYANDYLQLSIQARNKITLRPNSLYLRNTWPVILILSVNVIRISPQPQVKL